VILLRTANDFAVFLKRRLSKVYPWEFLRESRPLSPFCGRNPVAGTTEPPNIATIHGLEDSGGSSQPCSRSSPSPTGTSR